MNLNLGALFIRLLMVRMSRSREAGSTFSFQFNLDPTYLSLRSQFYHNLAREEIEVGEVRVRPVDVEGCRHCRNTSTARGHHSSNGPSQ